MIHFTDKDVQLANDYSGQAGEYYGSPKLHGARALAFRTESGWQLYSRAGNRWESMVHIEEELDERLAGFDVSFLDGELYNEEMDFETIQSVVRRVSTPHPRREEIGYYIFWAGHAEDFFSKRMVPTEEGLEKMRELEEHTFEKPADDFEFLPYVKVNLPEDAERIMELFVRHGFEGVVYRHPEVGYVYRRSSYLLKDKPFSEMECICVGFEEGKNGNLGAIIVEYDNGKRSKVSGFTEKMKDEVWENQDFYLGKRVEVKYGKLSKNGKLIEPSFNGWKLDR